MIILENGLEGQGPPNGEESYLDDAKDENPDVHYKTLKSFENSIIKHPNSCKPSL